MAKNFKIMLILIIVSLIMLSNYKVVLGVSPNIGVCYGIKGDNLPSAAQVVGLYKQLGIQKMRIYEPNPDVLNALRNSGIKLILGTLNQDIPTIASSVDAAQSWFATNVQPYVNEVDIEYINVGNELVPYQYSDSIVPAMQNLQTVLQRNNLGTKATTAVHGLVFGNSYPPSATKFSDAARPFMTQILQFLSSQQTPLLVNAYSYYPYSDQPQNIRLDYALGTATDTVVQDGSLSYSSLLDALVDSYYWAMESEGFSNVNLVIAESGWPHAGNGDLTTPDLASTYNRYFIQHISSRGTPKKPDVILDGYLFDIIDEDQKRPGIEQNWGLFNPSMQPNYPLF